MYYVITNYRANEGDEMFRKNIINVDMKQFRYFLELPWTRIRRVKTERGANIIAKRHNKNANRNVAISATDNTIGNDKMNAVKKAYVKRKYHICID